MQLMIQNNLPEILSITSFYHIDNGGRPGAASPRRISGASTVSGYFSDDHRPSFSGSQESGGKPQHWRYSYRRCREISMIEKFERKFLVLADEEEQRDNSNSLSLDGGGGGGGGGRLTASGRLPGQRKGSHDSVCSGRSNSIISSSWRKESVTIIEHAEPINEGEDDDDGGSSAGKAGANVDDDEDGGEDKNYVFLY